MVINPISLTKCICTNVFILCTLFGYGQDLCTIICPQPGDTVRNGELLIVFRLNPDLNIKPSSLDISIDRTTYKSLYKRNGNKVSVLVTTPLKKGLKSIRVKAKDENKNTIEKKWTFELSSKKPDKEENKNQEKDKTHIWFNIDADSRFSDVSGEGASLRQEPPTTQNFRLNGKVSRKNLEIPFKLYLTNHEDQNLPARNRFFVGLKTKSGGFYLGDINPYYNPLIINQSRIRGGEAFVNYRSAGISILYGVVNRPVEGLRKYYNSQESPSFPPVNLQDIHYVDSSLIMEGYYSEAGTYRRNIMAVKISAGSASTNNKFHFVVQKSTDDTTSIDYGGYAGQNLSMGMDLNLSGLGNRLKFSGGVAVAFTTLDIRRGIATNETIKELYGSELLIEPYKLRKLLVINATTTQTSYNHTPFLSYFLKTGISVLNQNISAEIKRIGSDYISFGNPYLINDRFIFSASDRMRFFKNSLYLILRYKYYYDNLTKINVVTNKTHMMDATFNYFIKTNWPRLNGGVRKYIRNGKNTETGETNRKYLISNYFGGIIYPFGIGEINNTITLNYNLNQRNYTNQPGTINSHSLYTSLAQNFPFGLLVNLQYSYMLLSNDTSNFSQNNTYGIQLGYLSKSKKWKVSLRLMQINAVETDFLPRSNRGLQSINAQYELFKNFTLKLEAGKSDYVEDSEVPRNYDELWLLLKLQYRFRN